MKNSKKYKLLINSLIYYFLGILMCRIVIEQILNQVIIKNKIIENAF